MSGFRRNLLKMGGGNVEEFVSRHMVCWYSPVRQGANVERLSADPRLVDLSGNGRNLRLNGFDWTNGSVITSDGGLQFDGNSCYGICESDFDLGNFTLIYRRGALPFHTMTNPGKCFCCKGRAFIIENTSVARCLSNYAFTQHGLVSDRTTHGLFSAGLYVVTPNKIIQEDSATIVTMKRGSGVDSVDSKLIFGCESQSGNKLKFVLEEFMLFDRVLKRDQLEWVLINLIDTDKSRIFEYVKNMDSNSDTK